VVTASYAATFKVVASGTSDLTYQWLQQASGENAFTAIDGATSASYTTPKTTLSDHGTKYKCIVANASGSVVSHEATLTVCSWPSVWIKSPLKNSSFMAGEDVTITANASQVNGTIVYVSFYNGSTLLGTDSTAPYTYTMSNITPGTYTLTATTKDFKGTYSKSSPVNITVSAPPAPKVNLIANSNKYLAPATITLTATPTQVDAEINRVDFYKDTLLLGSSNSAPYTLSWNNVASGNYSLTAKAFNSYGDHTTSNTVNITVSKPNVYVRNIDYNVYGQILQIQYGNGAVTAYTYDPLNSRLTRIYTSNAQAKVIQDLNYTYDSIGQVLSITDNVNTASQTFQYDALNRLTQATGAAYGTKTYTYDEVGNIITKDGLTYKYGENGAGPHAVTSLSDGTTITYDANGNMSTKSKSGEVMQYYYDAENRLTEVRKNMTLIAEYLYDGDGGRVQKTSYATTVNSVQSGLSYGALLGNVQTTTTPVITKYVGELYEETDNVGTNFIFLGGQRVAAIDTVSGSPVFYHGDHLGSTNVMTDSNGNQTELIEYDPYGKILRHDASAGSSRLAKQQFTGKMLDDETGLIYFGARYYDPSLGRFITPDTIIPETLNPQAFNRYSYANNNPVNFIDNDGHFAWFVAAIIGAVIGGAAGGISAYQSGGSVLAGIAVGALGGAVMGGTGAWIGGLVQAGTIGLGAGSAAMAGIGAATGAASSGILGGNVWQGALLGGLGGGLGFGAGGMLTSNFTKNIFAGGLTASVSTGGIVGGLGSELNGGSFGDGVLSGAIWGAAAFVAGYGAAKGYASYQQSKNQSYSYAFEETFEETSHQILDGPSTIEKVPNPYGRLGGPAHQAKVAEMAARLEAKGWSKIRIEAYLSNKGSTRGSAYVDLVATKNGRTLRVQVGKQTIVRQTPIAREVRNIYKIKGLIGPQEPGKSKIIFIPYNKP
jgi:RHS repeat-associated protein